MIVDDHPIVCEGLKTVLDGYADLEVVAVAANGEEALEQISAMDKAPDLVIVDLLMPKMDGGSLIDQILDKTNIVILSTEIDVQIAKSVIQKGIRGYLLKDEDPFKIADSVEQVLKDPDYIAISHDVLDTAMQSTGPSSDVKLTDQQRSLLRMIAAGQTNAEIADQLHVTSRTVKNYLSAIYQLLNVHNRAQAIAVAAKNDLI